MTDGLMAMARPRQCAVSVRRRFRSDRLFRIFRAGVQDRFPGALGDFRAAEAADLQRESNIIEDVQMRPHGKGLETIPKFRFSGGR